MVHIAYSDKYVLDLPPDHKFPMIKYELIREQLTYEGIASSSQITDPGLVDEETVLRTHSPEYWNKLKYLKLTDYEVRRIGFPLSRTLINRSLSSAMGTLYATRMAREHGAGMNVAGGTHHSFTHKGEAFCLLNDIAITSNFLLHNNEAKKILVVDLDVHQGNGTAQIFANDSRVFTFSMHGADNYPLEKEQSDLDIPLPYRAGDEEYLQQLKQILPSLINREKPDHIFYQAGVDVLATDRLGKLGMSREGTKKRDEIVLDLCYKHEIPVTIVMGGGYAAKIADIVEAHCNTFRLAFERFD